MHNSQLFCTLFLSCRAEGRKSRSRKASTWRNIHRCSSTRFTLIRPSGSLDKLGMTCRGASFGGLFFCHVERRAKPVVETSRRSGTFTLTVRTGSRLFHPRDPSTVLGVTDRNGYAWLGVTKKCTYFVVNREKCTTFGTSDPPERRGSRCCYRKPWKFTAQQQQEGVPGSGRVATPRREAVYQRHYP